MNWEAIGAVGEVLGAIGVIVTLGYLAVQIRQNSRVLDQTNEMHAANTYRANIDGVMNLQALLAQDERLGLIWKSGLADEDLSDAEGARFSGYLNMWLFDLENKFVWSRSASSTPAVIEADLVPHIEGQIHHLMQSRRVREWWRQNAERTFSRAWVSEVDRIRAAGAVETKDG